MRQHSPVRQAAYMNLQLHLCALDPAIAHAWESHFGAQSSVSIHEGNILDNAADAILSPANSFGFMDGGIDLAYSRFFGWELQERLQDKIREDYVGELPIGNAVIVPTHHREVPYLVSAPTMRVPDNIADTVNVYLAFRAALLAVKAAANIHSLLSPALGTGIGAMPIERAARQMFAAYAEVVLEDTKWRLSARSILRHHAQLLA
jgi:O-acetyl-ADP-ribose deacetylase (regulator of RNase III)